MNLTTLNRVKEYAGITGNAQDAKLNALIPLVSAQIAKFCQRDFELQEYKSWVDGLGQSFVRLPNCPITAVYMLCNSAMYVADIYRNSDAGQATVSSDATNLSLFETSSTGVATVTNIALADYKTITLLAAQVNTKSGWVMTAQSEYGDSPTATLRPLMAQLALYPARANLMAADNTPLLCKVIAEDMVEAQDGYDLYPGRANIFVWYKAGYTLPTNDSIGTLPEGLLLLANQIVMDVLNSAKINSNVRSESLGDYSYSLGEVLSCIKNRKFDLHYYRKVTI